MTASDDCPDCLGRLDGLCDVHEPAHIPLRVVGVTTLEGVYVGEEQEDMTAGYHPEDWRALGLEP